LFGAINRGAEIIRFAVIVYGVEVLVSLACVDLAGADVAELG
jgi:hypothetical protein